MRNVRLFRKLLTKLATKLAVKTGILPVEYALSKREREVLKLMVCGYSNKGIAAKLGITEETVKSHCTHIFRKLGVFSRTGAAVKAVRGQYY